MMKTYLVIFSCCVASLCYGYTGHATCPQNEEERCVQDCPPEKTCRNRDIQFYCLQVVTPCVTKCICKEGFIRSKENGSCVPMNACTHYDTPSFCLVNEEVQCVRKSCPAELTCQNKDNGPINCPDVLEPCKDECVCKDGYFRNSAGSCITGPQCDQCRRPNEYFECGPVCDNECATLQTQNKTNCPYVNIVCNPKCYCEDGFARDSRNNCIPISKCH